ncbi:hypothetical protein HHK36_012431 [Tetracentron sinense]|uniref:Uncharacterized protein n=1 Tax=Tetracentron sinense TaxID=13715 RepID=A0A835DFP8_TETSI|nr:hypothetical protein HHK36_012431 [Tetracentron sinense]
MASCSGLVVILMISVLVISSSTVDANGAHQLGWIPTRSSCQGSIADCLAGNGNEFDMDSEINRRILATSQYISYEALKRNSVPCSRRGASYYNCQPGAQANPYSRGCSAITRCRRGIHLIPSPDHPDMYGIGWEDGFFPSSHLNMKVPIQRRHLATRTTYAQLGTNVTPISLLLVKNPGSDTYMGVQRIVTFGIKANATQTMTNDRYGTRFQKMEAEIQKHNEGYASHGQKLNTNGQMLAEILHKLTAPEPKLD